MATRTSAIRIAVENLDASVAALRRGGEEGQKALERVGIGAQAANQNLERLGRAGSESGAGLRRFGILAQQGGYQLGDFAVQVQSGTNVVVAATQQISQFAGAFGLVGAAVGAAAAILGGTVSYFMKTGDEAGKAAAELLKLTTGTEDYKRVLEGIEPLQIAHLQYIRSLARAAEETAAANKKVTDSMPLAGLGAEGVGMGPLATVVGPQQSMADMMRARNQNINREYKAIDQYVNDRELAAAKLQNIKGGTAGTGGFYDYAAGAGEVETYREALAKLEQQQAKNAAKAASDAKAAQTLADANAKLLDQAKLNTQAAQEELEALTMGEDARKRANVERQYELDLLAAAQPAQKAVQLALIDEANARREAELATIAQSRALKEVQEQIDRGGQTGSMGQFYDTKFAGKSTPNPAVDDPGGYAKKQAKEQEDAMTGAWRNIAENVDTITTNMFDDILTKGKVSFQSLAEGIGDMFRTTITGALGDVVSAPLKDMVNKMTSGQGFNWAGLSQGQQLGVAGGLGGAGGYVAGSLYSQIAGKQGTYAPVGGAVGGAAGAVAGAAIGSAFPVIGTAAGGMAGGALGSIAGSFLGGLFGGEGLGNDQSVQKFASKVGKAIWSDKSFSEENRKVTGGIIEQLGMLGEALKSTGANISDFQLELKAGNKSGIAVQGKQYATADEALIGAIRLMLQNTGGLQGSQVTALANTKGRNVQEVMGDLAFAKEFDKITFAGTAAEAAMRDLGEQFDATGRKARELGLDEVALGAARERAMSQLTLAVQRQARDLQTQFQMATTSDAQVQAVLGVNQQFAQLTDTLTDAGYTAEQLAQVEASRAAAEQNVYRQAQEADRAQKQADAERRRAEAEQRRAAAEAAAEARRQAAEQRKQAAREARDLNAQFRSVTSTNDLVKQILSINTSFAQLRDTLVDAGYATRSISQLELARQREVSRAYLEAYRQGRDLNAQFFQTVSQSPLEKTLAGINLEFTHLIETLKDAGYTTSALNEVEKARGRALEEAIKAQQKQVADMQKDLESRVLGIGSFYDQLIQPLEAVNQNNMLNPQGQIGAARTAFQRDLAGAGAQDPEAIRRLAGSAGSFQQLVSQNYGTAGQGGAYLREIQGGLGGTIAGLQQERAAALADLPQIVERTTVDIIRENRADIDRVVEQLELLRRDLRGRGIAA